MRASLVAVCAATLAGVAHAQREWYGLFFLRGDLTCRLSEFESEFTFDHDLPNGLWWYEEELALVPEVMVPSDETCFWVGDELHVRMKAGSTVVYYYDDPLCEGPVKNPDVRRSWFKSCLGWTFFPELQEFNVTEHTTIKLVADADVVGATIFKSKDEDFAKAHLNLTWAYVGGAVHRRFGRCRTNLFRDVLAGNHSVSLVSKTEVLLWEGSTTCGAVQDAENVANQVLRSGLRDDGTYLYISVGEIVDPAAFLQPPPTESPSAAPSRSSQANTRASVGLAPLGLGLFLLLAT